jgi:hypothetical protein
MEAMDELFENYPETHIKLVRDAQKKRDLHRKKITAIEKKYPVYGLNTHNEKQMEKLRKLGVNIGPSVDSTMHKD